MSPNTSQKILFISNNGGDEQSHLLSLVDSQHLEVEYGGQASPPDQPELEDYLMTFSSPQFETAELR